MLVSDSPFKEQHGESKNSREEILIMSERFKILKIEDFLGWRREANLLFGIHWNRCGVFCFTGIKQEAVGIMNELTSEIVNNGVGYWGNLLHIFSLDIKGMDFHLRISLGALAHEDNILTILKFLKFHAFV